MKTKSLLFIIIGYIFLIILTSCNQETPAYRLIIDLDGGVLQEEIPTGFTEGTLVKLPNPSKKGYQFIGWFINDEIITNNEIIINQRTKIVAKWEACTYQITLNNNDDYIYINVKYQEEFSLPVLTKEGYNFLGWYLDDALINNNFYIYDKDITLEARWQENPYQIIFNDCELTPLTVLYGEGFTLPVITKEGYNFLGWYLNDKIFNDNIYMFNNDIVLEAKWEKANVIKYIGYFIDLPFDYIYNEPLTLPIPVVNDYTFKGWYLDPYYTGEALNIYTTKEDATLYAKWETNNKEIINVFPITLFNSQTDLYNEISIYQYGKHITATKYWQKIGVSKIDQKYIVSNIASSGQSIDSLGIYDYCILAYPNCPLYNDLLTNIEIGNEIKFSVDLSTLVDGTCTILVSIIHNEIIDDDYQVITTYLDSLYKDITVITDSISLVKQYQGFNIIWETSNKETISIDGVYHKPAVTRDVTLYAYIFDTCIYQHTFMVPGENATSNALSTGYIYTNYQTLTDEDMDKLDILYCAFANINQTADFTNTATTNNFIKNVNNYVMSKKNKHDTKILVSVNQEKGAFSTICKSLELREKLANNIVDLINQYGFDGVDIDWEYPANTEGSYWTLLIKEIYTKVKANNPNHLVTAAIGGGKWQPPRYDLANSHKYLDYINLMTYSMVSSNGMFQNALYPSTKGYTLNSCSIEESIKIYDSYNVPHHKILVGIAFYGIRQYDCEGVGQKSTSSASISYTLIDNNYLKQGYQVYFDKESQVPYIYDNVNKVFISFDNPLSIAKKCDYINTIGLGGIMFWQLGHDLLIDNNHFLINTISEYIRK